MIRVAIVEDSKESAEHLKQAIARYGKENDIDFTVSCFYSGIDFISDYAAVYDLVFMDIDMPYMNGLETAKKMRELDSLVSLIFVTNLANYAIRGYEVNAANFIVKPVRYESFCSKVGREIARIRENNERCLLVTTRTGKAKVRYSDIYYITVNGRYVTLHTKSGEMEMHISMKELEKMMEGSSFIRGDNSSMVNLMYVTSVGVDGAIVNGVLVPCSRNRRKALLDAFTLYLR